MRITLSALAVVLLCAAAPAIAQVETAVPAPHEQILSANPFGLLFGWFNAEYERRLSPATTWGVSGSVLDLDFLQLQKCQRAAALLPAGRRAEGVLSRRPNGRVPRVQ
jgi:hypothetical protein